MRVLVVGGAGFIGSHTARALAAAGHEPILFDNCSTGHSDVADRLRLPLVRGCLLNPDDLKSVMLTRPDAVMHFAAHLEVGESVRQPSKYYRNNVVGTLNLLDAMHAARVTQLVFSSTCATYGMPIEKEGVPAPLDESHPQLPINPYGFTKLAAERMMADFAAAYGFRYVALRYFNAAGASQDGLLGERHEPESHLIPLCLLAVLGKRDALTVFGSDYATPDGTCIRDYIHVEDLASGHLAALDYLARGGSPMAANLGTGHGYSVREVLAAVERVTGRPVPVREGARRPGDPPRLVAAVGGPARTILGWEPRHTTLEKIVGDAWGWFRQLA